MPFSKIVAGCLVIVLWASFPSGSRAQSLGACEGELNRKIAQLSEISNQISTGGDNTAALQNFEAWAERFHSEGWSTGDVVGVTVSIGTSSVGGAAIDASFTEAALGTAVAETGFAAAVLRSLNSNLATGTVAAIVLETVDAAGTASTWSDINANTQFMTSLIDYIEYGYQIDTEDSAMSDFVERHSAELAKALDVPVPGEPEQQRRLFEARAAELLSFFGQLEEVLGHEKFPRWRLNQQGRYGWGRNDIGYYKKVLTAYLKREIENLKANLSLVQELRCGEPSEQQINLRNCTGIPSNSAGLCTCNLKLGVPGIHVWGSGPYQNVSDICLAAQHAGLLTLSLAGNGTFRYQGLVQVRASRGCPYYIGSISNSVESRNFRGWSDSFYFPQRSSDLCDRASVPSGELWYCPETFPREQDRLTCHCTPRAVAKGRVQGNIYYDQRSDLCRSAAHAGVIGESGGTISAVKLGVPGPIEGTESNGIQSGDPTFSFGMSIGFY